jgi:hypothetical protein
MDIKQLNEVLAGKKIISVEEGTSEDWLLLNFDANEFELVNHDGSGIPTPAEPGTRIYLTVSLHNEHPNNEHYAPVAFHIHGKDGTGTVNMVRDHRDPDAFDPKAWKLDVEEASND